MLFSYFTLQDRQTLGWLGVAFPGEFKIGGSLRTPAIPGNSANPL